MKYTLLLSLQLLFSAKMFAQAIVLDSTFDDDGITTTDVNSASEDYAFGVAIQPDGKIVVTGVTGSPLADIVTIRYNSNGSPDPDFGNNGVVIANLGLTDGAGSILIQPDNKILVSGSSWVNSSLSRLAVVRYLENGLPDSAFGVNGTVLLAGNGNTSIYGIDMVLQTDGKIVVVGELYDSVVKVFAARLRSDGVLDDTFGSNGEVITYNSSGLDARSLIAATDGGFFITGNGYADTLKAMMILKYTSFGSLDSSYGTNGIQLTLFPHWGMGTSSIYQPDGKIIVVGGQYDINSGWYKYFLARFDENGLPDSTFDNDGIAFADYGFSYNGNESIYLQPDGKIILAGTTIPGFQFILYRYNSDGSLDSSFDDDGVKTTSVSPIEFCYALTLQQDNKIILAGGTNNGTEVIVLRYLTDLIPTAVNQYPDAPSMFSIYPNPCMDIAYCEYELSNPSNITLQLTDITGKVLRTFYNGKKPAGNHQEELNLSEIPVGTYILHFQGDNKSCSLLTVKQ